MIVWGLFPTEDRHMSSQCQGQPVLEGKIAVPGCAGHDARELLEQRLVTAQAADDPRRQQSRAGDVQHELGKF